MKRETPYAKELMERIEALFPGCVILRNDAQKLQGVPDRLILWGPYWAMLEVKRSANEEAQPNQPYYVELFGQMSFAAFIYPENEEEVLYALQQAFGVAR